jgi:hypothetical protein
MFNLYIVLKNEAAILGSMKVLIFITFLFAGVASGQMGNVSIGADLLRPTLVNHSENAIIGYVIQKKTAAGVNSTFRVFDIEAIAAGRLIQPGEEGPIGPVVENLENPLAIAVPRGAEGNIQQWRMAPAIGYKLMAVLFSDGTFYGSSATFVTFQIRMAALRRVGRIGLNVKALEDTKGEIGLAAAKVILQILNQKGKAEAEAALSRLASLPQVTRGVP